MKQIIYLLLLFSIVACSSEKSVDNSLYTISGKINLMDGKPNDNIEIIIYNDYYKLDSSQVVYTHKAKSDGSYSFKIPFYASRYQIHIAAPGYEYAKNIISDAEKELTMNANLQVAGVNDTAKTVKVVGNFCDFDWSKAIEMTKISENMFEAEIEFDKAPLSYQLLFNTETHSFSNYSATDAFEYDHGGDYRNIVKQDGNKYKITVDLSKFPKYTNKKSQDTSQIHFIVDSPAEKFAFIERKLATNTIRGIQNNYAILIEKKYPELIKDYTPEQMEKYTANTKKWLSDKQKLSDSLLLTSKNKRIQDYIASIRLRLDLIPRKMEIKDSIKLNKMQSIPAESIGLLSYWLPLIKKESKGNMNEDLSYIDDKIANMPYEYERNEARHSLMYSICYVYGDKKYRDELIDRYKHLKTLKYKQEYISKSIDSKLTSLQLSKETNVPVFEFTDFNGKKHNINDFKGKWILLNFWGIGCGYCKLEIPYHKDAYKQFKDKGFEIINISDKSSVEHVKKFTNEKGMKYIQTADADNYCLGIHKKFGVTGVPHLLLINPEGQFVRGDSINLRGKGLIKTLNTLLNK